MKALKALAILLCFGFCWHSWADRTVSLDWLQQAPSSPKFKVHLRVGNDALFKHEENIYLLESYARELLMAAGLNSAVVYLTNFNWADTYCLRHVHRIRLYIFDFIFLLKLHFEKELTRKNHTIFLHLSPDRSGDHNRRVTNIDDNRKLIQVYMKASPDSTLWFEELLSNFSGEINETKLPQGKTHLEIDLRNLDHAMGPNGRDLLDQLREIIK